MNREFPGRALRVGEGKGKSMVASLEGAQKSCIPQAKEADPRLPLPQPKAGKPHLPAAFHIRLALPVRRFSGWSDVRAARSLGTCVISGFLPARWREPRGSEEDDPPAVTQGVSPSPSQSRPPNYACSLRNDSF